MTREAQLQFCKVCVHQRKDLNLGILCGLTNRRADFDDSCADYAEDTLLKEKVEAQQIAMKTEGQVATQGKRFLNFIIDRVFVFGCAAIVGVSLALIIENFAPDYWYLLEEDNFLIDYGLGFVIGVGYYTFFEGVTGRSIGKYFTKTKVVTEDGETPDIKTIFIRSLCRFIPFDAVSFLGSDAVGWHDSISKTRVVTID